MTFLYPKGEEERLNEARRFGDREVLIGGVYPVMAEVECGLPVI